MRKMKRRKLRHIALALRHRRVRSSEGQNYLDIWDALFPDEPAEAERGRAKVRLAIELGRHLERRPIAAMDAAALLHLPLARAQALVQHQFNRFSLEELRTISQMLRMPTSLDG